MKSKKTKVLSIFILVMLLGYAQLGNSANLEKLFDYRSISDVRVSPDGTRAVFTVTLTDLESNSINSDLWLIDLKAGNYFQLTQSEKNDSGPAWSPDGKKIAFLSNRNGPNQIWVISPEGGEAELAADFGRVVIMQFRWLHHGDGFIFLAARPQAPQPPSPQPQQQRQMRPQSEPIVVDKSVTHYNLKPRMKARLLMVKFGDKKPQMLVKQDCHIQAFDISPDGKTVVFSSQPASGRMYAQDADLKILDLNSGSVRDLITRPGSDMAPQFSPDGKKIAYIHGEEGLANRTLHIIGTDGTGAREAAPSFDENIMDYSWSTDNNHIFFLGSRGVSRIVWSIDVSTGQYEAVRALDGLHVCESFSFSQDGRTWAAVISDAHSPEEVYIVENYGKSRRKLTSINKKFDETAPLTKVLKYKSEDGLDLEGLVIMPQNSEKGKPFPLLVIIHGGPAGVWNYGFNPRRGVYPFFSFVEQNYALFLPNPRGSTGYGEAFRSGNYRDFGGGDFRDIMTGVDLLIEKGIADPDRMGLMGWSYGGVMSYWMVTHTDRFKAISAGAGITNFISFYGTNDAEGVGVEIYFGCPPWENPQLFLDHSPLYFIRNAKTPLLIQHGGDDIRVPLTQAQEFYFAAIKVGLPVEMVVYPGQGHAIRDPRLALAAMEKNLDWFNKWLLGIEPPKKKD